MFTPGGGVDSVFLNNWFFAPSTTVHFLVGRADKVNAPLGTSSTSPTQLNMYDPTASNLSDPQSVWVSIARSTGNVVTSDNFPPPVSAATSSSMVVVGGELSKPSCRTRTPVKSPSYPSAVSSQRTVNSRRHNENFRFQISDFRFAAFSAGEPVFGLLSPVSHPEP